MRSVRLCLLEVLEVLEIAGGDGLRATLYAGVCGVRAQFRAFETPLWQFSIDHTDLIGTNWNTFLLITSILILALREINPSDMP